jgi:crotonobetainyl-CoA:carnitine CoA-transferase CaiB-like acyl-CoA transferase
VVDLGHQLAGPLAGLLLADQGATVVGIRRPGHRDTVAPLSAVLDRGTRLLELDLRDTGHQRRAREVMAEADVVVENFRPGVVEGWGLGYDDVRSVNPGVVYASLPGFAATDPRAAMPAWEGVLLAASGLLTDLSFWGAALSMPPSLTALPMPSVYASLHAAIGVTAGLIGRRRDGHGCHVTAPLLDAAMSAAAGPLLRTVDQPTRYNVPAVPTILLDRLNLRRLPAAVSAAAVGVLDAMMPPFFRSYRCGDDRQLLVVAVDNQSHIDKLLTALDLHGFANAAGLRRGDVLDAPAVPHNLYAYRAITLALWRLGRRMVAIFRTRAAGEWESLLTEAGIPCAVHRTASEWAALPPMRASGVVVDERTATGDLVTAPGPSVDLTSSTTATRSRSQGRGTRAFTGWDAERRLEFPQPAPGKGHDAPLHGIRVLDLANVIAGPVVSRTLAELGADVVHVDPVRPRMGPRMLLWIGQDVNQGKRSAAVDLTSPAGRQVLEALLPITDVVVHNKLPAQADLLGLSPARVHHLNPAAVLTTVTAWGGIHEGGWEHRPGYDPVIQAGSGITTRFGGRDTPAIHGVAATLDYATGFAGAFASLLGLWERSRGGENIVARTSLARIAGLLQLPFLVGGVTGEPTGLAARHWSGSDGLFRTRRGWIYLAVPTKDYPEARTALEKALGCRLPADADDAAAPIRNAIRRHSTDEVVVALRRINVAVHEVLDIRALRAAARPTSVDDVAVTETRSGDVLLVDQGAGRQAVYLPNPTWLRWNRRARHRLTPSPLPGLDTRDILETAGLVEPLHRWRHLDQISEGWDLPTGPLPA